MSLTSVTPMVTAVSASPAPLASTDGAVRSNHVNSSPTALRLMLRYLVGVVLAGLLVLGAAAVASHRIGYGATAGTSMQPVYHAGDVVVVARSRRYHAGQMVAYGGRNGNSVVLHRIIDGDANGFIVKGDSNQFADLAHPRADQLIGRVVLHISGVRAVVGARITHALVLVALLGLVGALSRDHIARASHAVRKIAGAGSSS
jgi:signal peptidase I